MFGPIRGPWPDHAWKGWWGDNPPYHVPVFVLPALGYRVAEQTRSEAALHVVIERDR